MDDIFSLQHKTILITGASSGIGRAIAIKASEYSADLIITGRDQNRLNETNDNLKNKATVIKADLTNYNDLIVLVKDLPLLDGIVFCAGVVEYTPIKFISEQKIKNVFSVNFDSQVLITQLLTKNKKLKRFSSLVYISSIASMIGVPATALYAASKAALNAFVKVTASELAGLSIRANSICPGVIKTPMTEISKAIISEETSDSAEKGYLLGVGEAKDVVGPTIFLLSDASKWITGTSVIVDGGLTVN